MKKRIIVSVVIAIVVAGSLTVVVMKKWELLPYVVIYGKVVDETGKPIENAKVVARFGITYGAPISATGPKGRFIARVFAFRWENSGKGPPSVTITKEGYREYWGYFVKEKSGGLILRCVTVRLLRGPEGSRVTEDL
jgi:hypothetical protein